jgi:hypothetical protein
MLYKLGRVLQFVGMMLLPVAIAGEMAGNLKVKGELIVAGIGIGIFFAGWLVQQTGKPP